jgi:nitrate/TMAO reductase-like tetraheme cytochrome c subunit
MSADRDTSKDTGGKSRRFRRWAIIAGVAVLLLIAVTVPAMVYTERPQFCPTCHEMSPYYDAWAVGKHAKTSCVDCHVDPGVVAHGLHKFVALKEVWDHFTKDNRFPAYTVELPNSRCIACHRTVAVKSKSRFSHAFHASKAACKDCHATTGHEVTLVSLRDAGILAADPTSPPVPGGSTPSSAPGHIAVPCQHCHDQAKMLCSVCHSAPHESRGECSGCHATGAKFVFTHPSSTDCAKCHKPPAGHYGTTCSACHKPTVPFAKTLFRHAGNTGEHSYRSFACAKCHPNGYSSASCTCHGGRAPSGD